MERKYDFESISTKYTFDARQVEKVCRISDFLQDVSNIPFLRRHLCLYGGTALTFVYSDNIPRLSIDVDFNYRHFGAEDWGIVREEIDKSIKEVLYAQRYEEKDLAIQSSYPLCRFIVRYTNSIGLPDSFNIEIGYMRRFPVLTRDSIRNFKHIGNGQRFLIKTPRPMEIFSNKWCTMLYRSSSRDLFDMYIISKQDLDFEMFRKCAIIDSLMRSIDEQGHVKHKLYEVDSELIIDSIPIDSGLRNLLHQRNDYDYDLIRKNVKNLSKKILKTLTSEEKMAIDIFYEKRIFRRDLIESNKKIFHKSLDKHPSILRTLDLLRTKK